MSTNDRGGSDRPWLLAAFVPLVTQERRTAAACSDHGRYRKRQTHCTSRRYHRRVPPQKQAVASLLPCAALLQPRRPASPRQRSTNVYLPSIDAGPGRTCICGDAPDDRRTKFGHVRLAFETSGSGEGCNTQEVMGMGQSLDALLSPA